MIKQTYDRRAALTYAHTWAYGRNPKYYDYEAIGGDCTNFASQCLYAGSGVMNFMPTFGWYYLDANHKAPAWTAVVYLDSFLIRKEESVGPFAKICTLSEVLPGDLVQLSEDGVHFSHTPIVVSAENPQTAADILVAAHSEDSDNRPLDTYSYQKIRFLHILGVNRPR